MEKKDLSLAALFSPRGVAVVGASRKEGKLGRVIVENLLGGKFGGEIYPLNPHETEILGLKVYRRLGDLPKVPDLVVIVIPAAGVKAVVREAIGVGVKAVVIISAGFGEVDEAGKNLEREIASWCEQAGVLLVGPNTIGVLNPHACLNASWMPHLPKGGGIALVSQSGALCCSILDASDRLGLKFADFCSVGNKAGLNESDFFRAWADDPQVSVIAAYLEDIKDGAAFFQLLQTTVKKPVVIFKAGKTKRGQKTIASHTGSLAGEYQVEQALFKQSGVIEATTTRDFLNYLQAFSLKAKFPQRARVALITNAGGAGIMATDDLVGRSFELAILNPMTKRKLAKILPPAASLKNPVDILGDADEQRYQKVAEILAADPEVDIILFLLTPQYVTPVAKIATVIRDFSRCQEKVFCLSAFIGDQLIEPGRQELIRAGELCYREVAEAVDVLARLKFYHAHRRTAQDPALLEHTLKLNGQGKFKNDVDAWIRATPKVLPEDLAVGMLQEVGLKRPPQELVDSLSQAVAFAAEHYPVVLKAPNNLITHKTDVKAVYLNLENETQVRSAYQKLKATLKQLPEFAQTTPPILIQKLLPAAAELFIGAKRTPFGQLLVMGHGGIYTEIYQDVARILLPASAAEIAAAFGKTKIAKILHGYRGQAPLNYQAVLEALAQVQDLLLLYPQLASLDLNPLLITKDGVVAVDAKIFVSRYES